jgi:hypothetical protein
VVDYSYVINWNWSGVVAVWRKILVFVRFVCLFCFKIFPEVVRCGEN